MRFVTTGQQPACSKLIACTLTLVLVLHFAGGWDGACAAAEVDPPAAAALMQVQAFEADWLAAHGVYAPATIVAQEFGLTVLYQRVFIDPATDVEVILSDDESSYLLYARSPGEFAVAGRDGLALAGTDQQLDAAVESLISELYTAQKLRRAAEGAFGSLGQLVDEGYLDATYAEILDSGGAAYCVTPDGVLCLLACLDAGESYYCRAFGATLRWTIDSDSNTEVACEPLPGFGALKAEYLDALLKNIIASEAAYYSMNGRYGTLQELAAQRFIEARLAEPPIAREVYEALTVELGPDGQRYQAELRAHPAIYVADETGVIQLANPGVHNRQE